MISGATGTGLPAGDVFDLAEDLTDLNRFYVSNTTGIFRTTDGGVNWTNVTPPGSLIGGMTNNLEMSVGRTTGALFVAVVNDGRVATMWRSTNQGATWQQLDVPEIVETTVNTVTGASNASPIVITSASAHGQNTNDRVQVSGIGGNTAANGTWTITRINDTQFSLNGSVGNGAYVGGTGTWRAVQGLQPREHPGSQGYLHLSILADPTNANLVYIGGDRQPSNNGALSGGFPNAIGATDFTGRLFRGDASQPSGSQWTPLTHNFAAPDGVGKAGGAPHADSRDMAFDAAGNLIEVDDGGVYKRSNPKSTTGVWTSLNGNIQVTEIYSTSYDHITNQIIIGTQDVGVGESRIFGDLTWKSVLPGDGGITAVDSSNPNATIHYSSNYQLGNFNRRTIDSNGNLLKFDFVKLIISGSGLVLSEVDNIDFIQQYVLNNVDPSRMLIGTNWIYESTNKGDTLVRVAGIGNVTAMAYGGRRGGANAPDVAYVGTDGGSGGLYLRTVSSGNFVRLTSYPGSHPRDISLDPEDWHVATVIDANNSIYLTTDAGATWKDLTRNLASVVFGLNTYTATADSALRTIALLVQPGAAADLIIVGGLGGVYSRWTDPNSRWSKLGAGLPNALVNDLVYDPTDDILVAGTFGRGVWTISNFKNEVLSTPRVDVSSVTQMLASGFNTTRQQHLGTFAAQADLPARALPLAPSALGSQVGLGNALTSSVAPLSLQSQSMAGLQADLVGAGFTVEEIVADDELDLLPPGNVDLVRATRTFTLGDLTTSVPMITEGLTSLAELVGIDLTGQLDISAQPVFRITVGVDSQGFYIQGNAADLLSVPVRINGQVEAKLGEWGLVSGQASLNVTPRISLITERPDGRIRLEDLLNDPTSVISLTVDGGAQLHLDLTFKNIAGIPLGFSADYVWILDAAGLGYSKDDDRSGFGLDLFRNLAGLVGDGLDALGLESSILAQLGDGLPLIGGGLAKALKPLLNSFLDYDLSGPVEEYLSSKGLKVISDLKPRDFVDGSYRTKDLMRLRLEYVLQPSKPLNVEADRSFSYDIAGLPVKLKLDGSFDASPEIVFNIALGFDLQGGPFMIEGATVDANLPLNFTLGGDFSVGTLLGARAAATARFDAGVKVTISDFDDVPEEKQYLRELVIGDSEAVDTFSIQDVFAEHFTQAVVLRGDLGFTMVLTLDNPLEKIPILGDLLAGALTWSADATYNLVTGEGTYNVDTAHLPSLGDIEKKLRDKFLGFIDRYNPLPQSLRTFLTTPIQFYGNQSLSELMGLGPVEIFIDPSKYIGQENVDVDHGDPGDNNYVALKYDVFGTIVDLLTGKPADLMRLEIGYGFSIDKSIQAVPDTVIASYFGIIDVTAGVDIHAGAGMQLSVTVGLDTQGFYVLDDGPEKQVLRLIGELGADLNVKGKLVIIDFAKVTGSVILQAFGYVDVVSPAGIDNKVYASELFRNGALNTSVLTFGLGLDMKLRLVGEVGFPNLGLTAQTPTYEKSFELYRLNSGGQQPGASPFSDIKGKLHSEATKLVCAAAVLTGDPIAQIGCVALSFEKIWDAIKTGAEWVGDRVQDVVNTVRDITNTVVSVIKDVVNSITSAIGDFFKGIGDFLGGIFGGRIEKVEPAKRFTYRIDRIGDHLTVSWDAGWAQAYLGAPNAKLIIENDGDNVIIQGPEFVSNEVVAKKKRLFRSDKDIRANVVQHNRIVLSPSDLVGIRHIDIAGSEEADMLIGRPSLLVPLVLDGKGGNDLLVASNLGSTLRGGSGKDTLLGGPGNDFLLGESGDDTLIGSQGNDTFDGGDGNDYLDEHDSAASGVDRSNEANVMYGGDGNDTLIGSPGRDTLDGGLRRDILLGGSGGDFLRGDALESLVGLGLSAFDEADYLDGGDGDDTMSGGAGDDSLLGGQGDDILSGGSEDDYLIGDDKDQMFFGNDTLFGDAGSDYLLGGRGSDLLYGGDGADLISGGEGNDLLAGADRRNNFEGGADDNDILSGDGGNDTLWGGASGPDRANFPTTDSANPWGADLLSGGDGLDEIHGGSGPDYLVGELDNDLIDGGSGNDTLVGTSGSDTLYGGDGEDTLLGSQSTDRVIGSYLSGDNNNDVMVGSESGADTMYGGGGNDQMTGLGGNDSLYGDSGDDWILANEGNDLVLGGTGRDLIDGGDGTDLLFGDLGTVTFSAGLPILANSTDPTLGGHDTIAGGAGEDIVFGGFGNDLVYGGMGNDILIGDFGLVTLDRNLAITVTSTFTALGGSDTIIGGEGNDLAIGGAGDDRIEGNADIDMMIGDLIRVILSSTQIRKTMSIDPMIGGDDTISGGSDDDFVIGGFGRDVIDDAEGLNRILGDNGVFDFSLDGNLNTIDLVQTTDPVIGGVDHITTGAGDDLILGGIGPDTLIAGDGTNVVLGDTGFVTYSAGVLLRVETTDSAFGDSDQISTGIGRDLLLAGAAGDTIFAGAGDNLIFGDFGLITFAGGAVARAESKDVQYGGNDAIQTGSGSDVIVAGTGADNVTGGAGADRIAGDCASLDWAAVDGNLQTLDRFESVSTTIGGNDSITGGDGNDVVLGGAGRDTINGNAGNDFILGDSGRVAFIVGFVVTVASVDPNAGDADLIDGGAQEDMLIGGSGPDRLYGRSGDDVILGDSGQVTYAGLVVSNVLVTYASGGGDDIVEAGDGDDVVLGGAGSDLVFGDAGGDLLFGDSTEVLFLGGFVSRVTSTDVSFGGNDTLLGGDGNDVAIGGAGRDSLLGETGNDHLIGDNARVTFAGPNVSEIASIAPAVGDSDVLDGGGGGDLMVGGASSDRLVGGLDSDLLIGDNGLVSLSFGSPTSVSTTDPTIGANDTIFAGEGDDTAIGGAGSDSVFGDTGNDILIGDFAKFVFTMGTDYGFTGTYSNLGGNDTISGGAGDDLLLGGFGNDSLSGDDGNDLIFGDQAQSAAVGFAGVGVGGRVGITPEVPPLASIDPAFGGNDTIYGGTGEDTLVGGTGGDRVYGGPGNDLSFGDQAQSALSPGWVTSYVSAYLEIASAGGADTLYGEAGNDTIYGGQGNDQVFGGTGNDELNGGFGRVGGVSGNDSLYGGNGTDLLLSDFADSVPPSARLNSSQFALTTDFSDGINRFTSRSGSWSVLGGRLNVSPGNTTAVSTRDINVSSSSYLDAQTTVNTHGLAGLVFDYRSATDFKYAAIVAGSSQVVLGRGTTSGLVTDAVISRGITPGANYSLGLTLRNRVATVYLNGAQVLSKTYGASTTTGQVGLFARLGLSAFDEVLIRGTDTAFANGGFNLQAAYPASVQQGQPATLSADQLRSVANAAIRSWSRISPGDAPRLSGVTFEIDDLPDTVLGQTTVDEVRIDPTAAGFGWFVDTTPLENGEFGPPDADGVRTAIRSNPADQGMDLMSVIMHELGHVLGHVHEESPRDFDSLMSASLRPGERHLMTTHSPMGLSASPSVPYPKGPASANGERRWFVTPRDYRSSTTVNHPAPMVDFLADKSDMWMVPAASLVDAVLGRPRDTRSGHRRFTSSSAIRIVS